MGRGGQIAAAIAQAFPPPTPATPTGPRRPNRDARRGVPVDQVVTINALLGGSDRRGAR